MIHIWDGVYEGSSSRFHKINGLLCYIYQSGHHFQDKINITDFSKIILYSFLQAVAAPENFSWVGIEGAKCISEGAKIKKIAKNSWF